MVRERQIRNGLESLFAECRYALRNLRKSSAFTAVAVFTLALGIGSTTAIFSVINGALLNPYPYKDAKRLATPKVFAADQFRAWRFPAAAFVDFREQNHTFDDVFGLVYHQFHLTRSQGAEEFPGGWVTPGTFESLGIRPFLGRTLTTDDAKAGAPPVFVISYKLWTKVFGRDKNILGATYTLDATRMTLVGIMPPRFQIGEVDLWLPLDIKRDTFVPGAGLVSNEILTVGHLKLGVSPQTAAADLQVIASPFQTIDPIYFPPQFKIVVNTLNGDAVGGNFQFGLFALMGAVTMLLLVACSNVANLLLARATTREQEFGIRSALGASRFRLVRQLLVESFLLALVSCALGCLFAYLGLKAMIAFIPANTIPLEAVITLSPVALLFSLSATIFTTLVCGLAPALHALRSDCRVAPSTTGKGAVGDFRHGNLRSVLVVAEVSLAIVLLVGSGLLLRSLTALRSVNLTFNPSQVVYADISWPERRYDGPQKQHLFLRQILDHISQLPGVQAVSESSFFPPYTFGWTTVAITGKPRPQNRNTASIFCSEGYFHALNLPLLRGTLFSRNDIDSPRHVAIVNQSFARDRFGQEDPIGHRVRFSDYETWPDWPHDPYFEIIGVVGDAKNSGLQDPPRPEIYLPASLTSAAGGGIIVRSVGNASLVLKQIRAEILTIDSEVAISEAGTIADLLQQNYFARPRFLFITLCTFATISLLLVAAGVFSVISYTVVMRTHEIGIRMALGAHALQIVALVLNKGMRLILCGIVIGLSASAFLTRFLASQIWGVSTTDPLTFGAITCMTLFVGILACLIPARRASRLDPLVALRYE
jgi:putative ABC transport system permease protein